MKKYLILQDKKSNKFWQIEVKKNTHWLTYGKLGSKGTSKSKKFKDTQQAKAEAEKLIKTKLKKGYCESKVKIGQKKKNSKIQLDTKSKGKIDWQEVEKEFVIQAKKALVKLAKTGKKEKALTFWIHVDRMPVYIYTEEFPDSTGVGGFHLKSLQTEFDREKRTAYKSLERGILKAFTQGCKMLKKTGAFNQLLDGYMTVWVATVDTDRKMACTVGDIKKSAGIFEEHALSFDLSMMGKGLANKKWWFAEYDLLGNDELDFGNAFKKIKDKNGARLTTWDGVSMKDINFPKLKGTMKSNTIAPDWIYCSQHEVWSYRLVKLLKAIGVTNIETFPMEVFHQSTKQKSETYYHFVNVVGANNRIIAIQDGKKNWQEYDFISANEYRLRGRKTALENSKQKLFRVASVRNSGLAVDNEVKLACEKNGITGIKFREIPFLKVDEVKILQEQIKKGNSKAHFRLGIVYSEGLVVKKDLKKATAIFEEVLLADEQQMDQDYIDEAYFVDRPQEHDFFQWLLFFQEFRPKFILQWYKEKKFGEWDKFKERLLKKFFKVYYDITPKELDLYLKNKSNKKGLTIFKETESFIIRKKYEEALKAIYSARSIEMIAQMDSSDLMVWKYLESIACLMNKKNADASLAMFYKIQKQKSAYQRLEWSTGKIKKWLKSVKLETNSNEEIQKLLNNFE